MSGDKPSTTIAAPAWEVRPRPKRRLLRALGHFLRTKPLGAAGGAMIGFLVLLAVIAPLVSPYTPTQMHTEDRLQPPGARYMLGTDALGRDVLSRIIYGSQVSLYVGLLSVSLATVVGTAVGLSSGYLGGKYDLVMQRIVDALMSFPTLVFALGLMAALGTSLNNVILAIGITLSPTISRVVRGSVLSTMENQYMEAARAIGCGHLRISLQHLLPNVTAPIIILATADLGTAILIEATLGFLGMGVPPPTPTWGAMLSGDARLYLERAPWLALFPGFAISLAVLGFNLLGDALRDVWDPRLRGTQR